MRVNTRDLSDALSLAIRVLDKRQVIPELASVKLTFVADRLDIEATNISHSISVSIGAETEDAGIDLNCVCVDALILSNLVAKIQDEYIDFSIDGHKLGIKRKSGKATLLGLLPDQFPTLPTPEGGKWLTVDGNALKRAFSAMLVGTDNDAALPQNQVVEFKVENGKFRCASSDANRIAVAEGDCEGEDALLMIPLSALRVVLPALGDEPIKMTSSGAHVFLYTTDANYSFLQSAIKPRNIDMPLSLNYDKVFQVDAKVLSNALELVKTLADPRNKAVKFTFNGNLTLAARGQDGNIEESLDIETGLDFFTGYNVDYLLPILRQVEGQIYCKFYHDHRPSRLATDGVSSIPEQNNFFLQVTSTGDGTMLKFLVGSMTVGW